MKTFMGYVGLAILGVGLVLAMLYGVRLFSNAATPITLHQVKPGVTCATMVTGDGAAIDCWKD